MDGLKRSAKNIQKRRIEGAESSFINKVGGPGGRGLGLKAT